MIAGFALGALGVVAGVLIQRHGAGEVRATDDIAAAPAVVLTKVPCESGLADGASDGRFVGLETRILAFDWVEVDWW